MVNMTFIASNETITNAAARAIALNGLGALLLPVLAIVWFPTTVPVVVLRTNLVDRKPQAVTLMGAKAAVPGHLTALFAGMGMSSCVSLTHTLLGAIFFICCRLAAYHAGIVRKSFSSEIITLFGAELLVRGWLSAAFTGMRFGRCLGRGRLAPVFLGLWSTSEEIGRAFFGAKAAVLRRLATLLTWMLRMFASGCIQTFCRAMFAIKRQFSALETGVASSLEPTFFRAVLFLGPNEELAAIGAVGCLSLGQATAFLRAVFLDFWGKPRATSDAVSLGQLVGFLAVVRAELVSIFGEGRPAVQAWLSLFRCSRHINAPCGICP